MSRAGKILVAAAMTAAFADACCLAQSPPCPASKYPNTNVGTCTWYLTNCGPGGSMAYLPCNHGYGNCTTYENCVGVAMKSGVSNPGSTDTYVANSLKNGYQGKLSPRLADAVNNTLDWGKAPGTEVTVTVLEQKDLMIAVPDGDATNYVYSQALRLRIEFTSEKGDKLTHFSWRVIETAGPPPADVKPEFVDGTTTTFPGVVRLKLPNAESGKVDDPVLYIALLRERAPVAVNDQGGVNETSTISFSAPAHPTANQISRSRRQLRWSSCR